MSFHVQNCVLNQLHLYYRKSLQFYRGSNYDTSMEFDEIVKQKENQFAKAKCDSNWMSTFKVRLGYDMIG